MMPKQVQITPDVRAVLVRGDWNGRVFKLPSGHLDRPLYAAVDKALKALGGNWRKADGGHVFPAMDAPRQLAEALQAGVAADQKRTAEQFFTPADLAARMAKIAVQRGDHVLEPSAGMGVLIRAALDRGAEFITAVESDEILAGVLMSMVPKHGSGVWLGDFMAWKPVARAPIDVVLMNPPFSRNQDIEHVNRALGFLRPGGRLVAIMSPHFTFAQDAHSRAFRTMIGYPSTSDGQPTGSESVADASVELLPKGTFQSAGTNVASVLVTIQKAA